MTGGRNLDRLSALVLEVIRAGVWDTGIRHLSL